ncbi:E3 ubiquitin-protein ligase UHRF1 [Holothuria leucospilota]|uniref:RING-type E3 ubiquitin transferase n=1 Tax=Holothuria leucospilota TaxID=206669 RepID=A0A9Q1H8T8_HOLLE|nr:E3 ubiquitin-protein ligase UHRF1 [Holothuria leucospilota]
MWIQVRTFDGKTSKQIDGLSKLTKIEDLQKKLVEPFDAPIESQRLFYRGKQLVNGHTLFDYDVGLNNIIQLMVRKNLPQENKTSQESGGKADSGIASDGSDTEQPTSSSTSSAIKEDESKPSTSSLQGLYKVGDIIDAMDLSVGAWFEAEIVKVTEQEEINNNQEKDEDKEEKNDSDGENKEKVKNDILDSKTASNHDNTTTSNKGESGDINHSESGSANNKGDGLVYHVKFEDYDDQGIVQLSSDYLRPRARTTLNFDDISVGDVVMANYNCDEPNERGFWYDVEVTQLKSSRTVKEIVGNIRLAPGVEPLTDCRIRFTDEIFKIEKHGEVSCDPKDLSAEGSPIKRLTQPECDRCKDKPSRKCKYCSCHQCGGKEEPDKQIMCDECDMAYHIYCLDPPLSEIPDVEEWYCPLCKNDTSAVVHAGERLKGSKKKSKMASAKSTSSRDWGKGMACQGRTKVCTIVPPNHFGSIPGIHVGQMWKFRVQVSEAGVHRPQVGGIHGRENEGAFSIVLSGAFLDEKDNGDDFTYTGSGGRDLSGNKRTAEQSCDQKLTKMNLALARNCNAPLDRVNGNEAQDWRGGKPVRVVRNCKGRKHSKYAPEEGNRYDGIFKVVKYWPERGKSGFLVWRYLLRRDDPEAAPWSKAGKERVKKLGLTVEYPEGYLEAMAAKEREKSNSESDEEKEKKSKGKRKLSKEDSSGKGSPSAKKRKQAISSEFKKQIKEDVENTKIWNDVIEAVSGGEKLLTAVEEAFTCICCQEVVYKPITTPCKHNVCKSCLQRSFKADVHSCPYCRHELGKGFDMTVNDSLSKILCELFPGYEAGR